MNPLIPDQARARRSAAEVLRWLDAGGRELVQAVVRRAVEQTKERNRARQLPPGFLNKRIDF